MSDKQVNLLFGYRYDFYFELSVFENWIFFKKNKIIERLNLKLFVKNRKLVHQKANGIYYHYYYYHYFNLNNFCFNFDFFSILG